MFVIITMSGAKISQRNIVLRLIENKGNSMSMEIRPYNNCFLNVHELFM